MEEELQHFTHRHPLYFMTSLDRSVVLDLGFHICLLCGERITSGTPFYGCKNSWCTYIHLHKSCAELPEELQHPLHLKHPLTLGKSIQNQCDSCRSRPEFYSSYRCNCSCCEFTLCVKCASLPLAKTADIHDHPLTLMRKLSQFTCDYCEEGGNGMFYFCSTCSFMVHPECTLSPLIVRPLIIEAEIHDHPLTLARKLILFTCDACGKAGRGMFYFCAKCSFVVHLDCASLPSVVKVIRHDHPLKLVYSLPAINTSSRGICQLCVNMVDKDYRVYYCLICDFVAHLYCATSKEEKDETFVWKSKDEESMEDNRLGTDESMDLLTYVVKKTKLGVDGIEEIAAEIKYFSHEHDLKLTNKLEINKKCDACMRYIIVPPFYACAQCAFYLHKSCVELRSRIRHPLHQHPLTLLPRAPPYGRSTFGCNVCDRSCDGFTYHCKECQYDLDVQCSSIPYKLTHDSHEHQLTLSRSPEGRKCNHCNPSKQIPLLCCAECEFALDFKCLTLPKTIPYEQHQHLFTLCYVPEDDSGEYYCDICEEERDSKCWFYYCADCLYPAHLECILESLPSLWE